MSKHHKYDEMRPEEVLHRANGGDLDAQVYANSMLSAVGDNWYKRHASAEWRIRFILWVVGILVFGGYLFGQWHS